jgi:hypothetical protein
MINTVDAMTYTRFEVLYAPARRTAKPAIMSSEAHGSRSVVRHEQYLL